MLDRISSWYLAKAVCLEQNAVLAEIDSPAESQFLLRLTSGANQLQGISKKIDY